jgi:hypothetical protein
MRWNAGPGDQLRGPRPRITARGKRRHARASCHTHLRPKQTPAIELLEPSSSTASGAGSGASRRCSAAHHARHPPARPHGRFTRWPDARAATIPPPAYPLRPCRPPAVAQRGALAEKLRGICPRCFGWCPWPRRSERPRPSPSSARLRAAGSRSCSSAFMGGIAHSRSRMKFLRRVRKPAIITVQRSGKGLPRMLSGANEVRGSCEPEHRHSARRDAFAYAGHPRHEMIE